MEEKEIKTEQAWDEEALEDKPKTDSKYFSDSVPEGQLSFKTELTFKTNGESKINNYKTKVVNFIIEVGGKEKIWEVSTKQWELLKIIAQKKKDNNGTLIGVKATLERTGSNQTDTRRAIKF
jgi:hypothetical protein